MNVTGGAVDVTTYFTLRLAATGVEATALTITGFDLQYVRSGVAPSAKVDATALAATDSAHGDNQAIEIDATDQPGLYRVDWPDAAFAAGVKEVILTVKVATCFTEHLRVQIDAPVNVTKLLTDAQSATDLKDFADDGYDPSTNKVQGVVLVDTVTTYTGNTPQTGDSFARIGVAGAGLTNIDLPDQTMNITGDITGNLSGSVGSVTDGVTLAASAVQAIWNALTSALTTVGSIGKYIVDRLDAAITSRASQTTADADHDLTQANIAALNNLSAAQVATALATYDAPTKAELDAAVAPLALETTAQSILADTGTDGVVVAAASKTGYALTSAERNSIADAHLDRTDGVEAGVTPRQQSRVVLAAAGGKCDGAATTTMHYRDQADAKNRITATVDENGNRTAVTLDVS